MHRPFLGRSIRSIPVAAAHAGALPLVMTAREDGHGDVVRPRMSGLIAPTPVRDGRKSRSRIVAYGNESRTAGVSDRSAHPQPCIGDM